MIDLENNILILLLAQYIGICLGFVLVLLVTVCLGFGLLLRLHLRVLCSCISLLLILDLFLVSDTSFDQIPGLAFFNLKNSSLSSSSNSELMSRVS